MDARLLLLILSSQCALRNYNGIERSGQCFDKSNILPCLNVGFRTLERRDRC